MKKEGLPNIFILYVRWKQFFKFWVLLVSSSSLARNSYLQRFVVYFLLQFTYFKLENLRFTPIHIMYSRTRICLVNSFRYLSSYDSISRHQKILNINKTRIGETTKRTCAMFEHKHPQKGVSVPPFSLQDRKRTLQEVEEVLNTKVVPKELVGDIKVN